MNIDLFKAVVYTNIKCEAWICINWFWPIRSCPPSHPFSLFHFPFANDVTLPRSLVAAPSSRIAWVNWQCSPFHPTDKVRHLVEWVADRPISVFLNSEVWLNYVCEGHETTLKSNSLLQCHGQYIRIFDHAFFLLSVILMAQWHWGQSWSLNTVHKCASQCNQTQAPSSSVWVHRKTNIEMKGLHLQLLSTFCRSVTNQSNALPFRNCFLCPWRELWESDK